MAALNSAGPAAETVAWQGPGWTACLGLLPCAGEVVCGDRGAVVARADGGLLLVVADGLGHGEQAAVASQTAVDTAAAHRHLPPRDLLALCDGQLRATRGAAVTLIAVDLAGRQLVQVGVGNVGTLVVGTTTPRRRLAAVPGIVGTGLPSLRDERLALAASGWLALFSDGVDPLFDRSQPPGLFGAGEPAAVVDACLARSARRHDDAALLILRWGDPA